MVRLIKNPARIPVPGGKLSDEYGGRVASTTSAVSVARMQAPPSWGEPAQAPDFDEVILVLTASLLVDHDGGPDRDE